MSDRSSAYIFGRVFEMIVEYVPREKHDEVAAKFWKESRAFDFSEEQMCADDALTALGYLTLKVDPKYPDEGPVHVYAPPPNRAAPMPGPDTTLTGAEIAAKDRAGLSSRVDETAPYVAERVGETCAACGATFAHGGELRARDKLTTKVRGEVIKAAVDWVDHEEGHGCADALAIHLESLFTS